MVLVCWLGSAFGSLMGSVRWSHYRRQHSARCQQAGFHLQSFFSFLTDSTNRGPTESVSACLTGAVDQFFEMWKPREVTSISLILSLNLNIDGSKYGKKYWVLISHKEKIGKFVTCQILWATLTVFVFPVFSLLACDDWSYLLPRSGLAPFS